MVRIKFWNTPVEEQQDVTLLVEFALVHEDLRDVDNQGTQDILQKYAQQLRDEILFRMGE